MVIVAEEPDAGRQGFRDRLALWISAAASPFLVVPLFVFLVAAASADNARQLFTWMGVCVGFAVFVPFLYIMAAVRKGYITDLHIGMREQRKVPYLLTMASMGVGLLALVKVGAPEVLVACGVTMLVNAAVFLLITQYWKVSVHSSVLAGCILALAVAFSSWNLLWLMLLVPVVMWARVQRKRHSFAQGLVAVAISLLLICVVFHWFGLL